MDTLISVGTLSAYAWSLFALFFGRAGMTGMTMRFELTLRRDTGAEHLYLEVASAVIVFLLAGRYFEGRSKREAVWRCERCSRSARRRRPCSTNVTRSGSCRSTTCSSATASSCAQGLPIACLPCPFRS